MPLEVYLDPCTINCRKVLAGLSLLQVPYNLHHIDYFNGEQKSESFKKINPCATVPAATDGDLTLTESNAILQYAADLSTNETPYPRDLKGRANVNRWLLWEASVWFQTNYVYLVENVVKPLMNSEPDQELLSNEASNYEKLASILEDQLSKTKYVCGPNVTIADIAIASPMHLHAASKLPLQSKPNIQRWLKDVEAHPWWQKTQGAVDKALLPHGATNGSKQAHANGTTNGTSSPLDVRATLNYTKALEDKLTELYFYEDGEGRYKNIHEPGDDAKELTIKDAWRLKDQITADTHGFSLHDFHSEYIGLWEDEQGVKESFYPEVVEFVKRATGARRVLVFDHTIRTRKNAGKKLTQETNTSQRQPVALVHCDYTAESGPTRVKQLLGSEADDLLSRRVAFFNVWKPLASVEEMPLAMCSTTSSPPEDYFKLYLRYRDRTGENYVMRFSDKHEWWYFPGMTEEQVILLKTYESETDGRARFVGHSAFVDPNTKADARVRESVEVRTIAFF